MNLFYLGYDNRETAARNVQRQFRVILDEAGIKDGLVTVSCRSLES